MYTIYLDDECLYYPGDTVNTLNKAVIKEGVGDAGSIDLNGSEHQNVPVSSE